MLLIQKIKHYSGQILSNIKINWSESSTYTGIIMLITTILSIFHHEAYKIYLSIGASLIGALHALFPNNLKITAFNDAVQKEAKNEQVN